MCSSITKGLKMDVSQWAMFKKYCVSSSYHVSFQKDISHTWPNRQTLNNEFDLSPFLISIKRFQGVFPPHTFFKIKWVSQLWLWREPSHFNIHAKILRWRANRKTVTVKRILTYFTSCSVLYKHNSTTYSLTIIPGHLPNTYRRGSLQLQGQIQGGLGNSPLTFGNEKIQKITTKS